MIIADVMAELGRALRDGGIRTYDFPPDQIYPPAAVIAFFDSINYDQTMGRGEDRMSVPVVLVVGRADDRAAATELVKYADGSGPKSAKALLDDYPYTTCDVVTVVSGEVDTIDVADVEYIAITFTVDVVGAGA